MKKIKITIPKKYLCIWCGKIFIAAAPKEMFCKDCIKIINELKKDGKQK